ncbi:MAG: hypothetical protein KAW66_13165, partial [Candidatus Lokiarchaeota archaeon]|nr:hypothetical protein [Candidatus Lokiarchaeota archaeon]
MVEIILSQLGWIDAISIMCFFLFNVMFGLYLVYKSRKTKAKLLLIVGIAIISIGFGKLHSVSDFIVILLTGRNLDVSIYLRIFLHYTPSFFYGFFAVYIGIELLMKEKKIYASLIVLVLLVLLQITLYVDPTNSVEIIVPIPSGLNLVEINLVFGSLVFILAIVLGLFAVVFSGFGLFLKSFQVEGLLKKKYMLLAIGVFLCIISLLLETITTVLLFNIIFEIGQVISAALWYLGLREEDVKIRDKPKKDVAIEEGLFRLTKRPDNITEEEVTFHREKKICLVC